MTGEQAKPELDLYRYYLAQGFKLHGVLVLPCPVDQISPVPVVISAGESPVKYRAPKDEIVANLAHLAIDLARQEYENLALVRPLKAYEPSVKGYTPSPYGVDDYMLLMVKQPRYKANA